MTSHPMLHLIPPECDCSAQVHRAVMIRGKPYLVCSSCDTRTPTEPELPPPASAHKVERELALTLAVMGLIILVALISGCVVGAVS